MSRSRRSNTLKSSQSITRITWQSRRHQVPLPPMAQIVKVSTTTAMSRAVKTVAMTTTKGRPTFRFGLEKSTPSSTQTWGFCQKLPSKHIWTGTKTLTRSITYNVADVLATNIRRHRIEIAASFKVRSCRTNPGNCWKFSVPSTTDNSMPWSLWNPQGTTMEHHGHPCA
eukprot:scaffold23_cov175-Amphora_coffeaeformis.AAC.17